MQNLKPHPILTESESAFQQDPPFPGDWYACQRLRPSAPEYCSQDFNFFHDQTS